MPSGPNMGKWVDSSAVRFTFFRPLGEAILEAGGAVLNYAVHAATPLHPHTATLHSVWHPWTPGGLLSK